MITEKEKCECGAMAVWVYMPGYSSGANPYSCEDCVPRGCSCNWENIVNDFDNESNLPKGTENKDWRWITDKDRMKDGLDTPIEEKKYWIYLDDKGRESPCGGEYEYEKEGWDVDKEPIDQVYERALKNGDVITPNDNIN
jgi:hypothetical protein